MIELRIGGQLVTFGYVLEYLLKVRHADVVGVQESQRVGEPHCRLVCLTEVGKNICAGGLCCHSVLLNVRMRVLNESRVFNLLRQKIHTELQVQSCSEIRGPYPIDSNINESVIR